MNPINIIYSELAKGKRIDAEELLLLMKAGGPDETLLSLADELNTRVNGPYVTFVHNRNINYTNICVNNCLFCAYKRNAGDSDSYVLSVEDTLQRISQTPDITEVCIQGGISAELDFDFILEMVGAIREAHPHIHIHAFSPMEIRHFARTTGTGVEEVFTKLIDRGLDSIPGTAAEILDDDVRRLICPEKLSSAEWVDIISLAHRLGLKSTATILVGHAEKWDHIAHHFDLIREIQKKTGGFTEFIPLFFIPYSTRLGHVFQIRTCWSLANAARLYALARIFFHGTIDNIQSSWPKLGLDNAVSCLSWGVNDLGGTLYEENITRQAGGEWGQYVELDEFKERILACGKIPRQRDTLYNSVQVSGVRCQRDAELIVGY